MNKVTNSRNCFILRRCSKIYLFLLPVCLLLLVVSATAQTRLEFGNGSFFTSDNKFGITFSPKMDVAYFTRAKGKWGKEKLICSIYFSKKINGNWSQPEIAGFSGKYNDREPHLSHDGKKLYFTSERPNGLGSQSYDIWVVNKLANGNWGEPENLGAEVNSKATEYSPRTTSNGDLYFASDRQGGFGQGDLYFCKLTGKKFSQPQNLGKAINLPEGEWNLEISADGKILVFEASERKENLSSFGDLYISFRQNNSWTIPQNIVEVNTTGSDLYAYLTKDRKYLYYSSTNSSEHTPANIYQIDFPKLAKKYRQSAKLGEK